MDCIRQKKTKKWKQPKKFLKNTTIYLNHKLKEEKKINIEIITSMINPKEWFEDITKRAKILREKYFKGKE